MSDPGKFYLSHMHAKTGYRATWDPTKKLEIGYIGKLDKGILNIYSSLEKEGIPVELASGVSGAAMDYTSHDNVTISTKLSGELPVAGSALAHVDAGFHLEFKSEKSIVFQTGNHKIAQLVNLAEIEPLVLEKYENGNWDKSWVIITELATADSATIIISNSSNGNLDLKANAQAGPANLKLTDVSLGLSVARERGSSLKYIAQHGLTPLYRVMGIRHPVFSDLSIGVKGEVHPLEISNRLIQIDFDERELE